ncbi:hypothetical protein [Spirosoma sp. KUDC1026]|uniref:hypothetical protein n=1 Tax=Spirosoma sp. KUDC1026 TaxID=2745947 RepID=UPI00159BBF96|nr:hypothetical protein [Spirosoma sp. KUDC1026]QKZ11263.1 hypothetical protein HU175_00870 [Spirosoma sp. KUDC1026]
MSKILRYTLVGEGFAEYQFIPTYMNWVTKENGNVQAVRTNIQIAISKNPSVSKVLQEAASLCALSFADKKSPCNLFIAGIDLDTSDFTDDLEYHSARLQEIINSMGKVYQLYKDKVILFVPIQAIDCWIHYVQSDATPNSLESTNKDDTKRKVYGSRQDRPQIEKVAREAGAKADFNKLARQSRSFKHFHQQVVQFVQQYNKDGRP